MGVSLHLIGLLLSYHSIEFGLHFHFQQNRASFSDFYLDLRYWIFISISLLESRYSMKHEWISLFGTSLFISGAIVRSFSILQLKKQFTLQVERRSNVKLMQTGLYSIVRHPGYCGFWLMVVGGQLLLGNIVCLVAGVVLMKRYFEARIQLEEALLVKQANYAEYKRKVWHAGIPFANIL